MRTPDDFAAAFAAIAAGRADALHAYNNPINAKQRKLIAEFAIERRLPSSHEARDFVDAGGLVSYAPSATDLCRRAATYVDKILKGAKPAELPVEQPMRFELVFNLKTANAIGVTVPPTPLQLADALIR